ncbi:MAG: hypothetical protein ACRD47_11595 [Nitrososphaeraceae archaeon]
MKSGNTKVATDRLFHRLNNIQRVLKLEEDHHYFDDCGDGDGDGGQPNWFIVHFHSLTGYHLKKIAQFADILLIEPTATGNLRLLIEVRRDD